MVETEASIVRYFGDKAKAKEVYAGVDALTAQDIAETVVFTTSRAPHVQIASVVVFACAQSAAKTVHRRAKL